MVIPPVKRERDRERDRCNGVTTSQERETDAMVLPPEERDRCNGVTTSTGAECNGVTTNRGAACITGEPSCNGVTTSRGTEMHY